MAKDYMYNNRLTVDLRRQRAMAMTAHVMQIVSKYVRNDETDALRHINRDLFELFHDSGIDVVTDQMRQEAGLPPRDEDGWTPHELQILEAKRIETMLKPLQVVLPTGTVLK